MVRYLILYFFTGFSALIYQVVWARMLLLTFGSTVLANTIVIVVFMLGLGIGGLYFGTYVDKIRNPQRLFSLLQIGIGLFSSLLVFIFPQLPYFYKVIITSFQLSQTNSLFTIFLIAFLLLFFPTFLMGGTFPVMNRIYIQRDTEIKKGIGLLYGFNTLGGVLGALLSGFFFIRNFGFALTQLIAVFINLIIGIFMLWRRTVLKKIPERESGDFKSGKSEPFNLTQLLPLFAGLTGFASLACEVFWIRALSIFLTNSTYTFSVILAIFLIGIFIGSLIFTKISGKDNLKQILALVQILTGLCLVVGCLFMNQLPSILFTFQDLIEKPVYRIFLPALLLSVVVVLIPTVLMGISFPLMCSLYSKSLESLGNKIGKIYFVNTIGCALGSLFTGLFFIQLFGVIRGLVLISTINLTVGLFFTLFLRRKILNLILIVSAIIIAIYSTQKRFILPPSIYHTPIRQDRVLYYKETRDGTIIVSEDRITGVRSAYVNNSAVIGTTYDALKVVKMLGNLPFVFNPEAKDVLVIGFGVGVTTSAIAQYDVKRIDCVEICPGLREASQYFVKFNNYIFKNPRVNFISNDGRNFLVLSNKKYDIISCDPTHPILGSGNLYTKEYFLLCKEHLNENGVVCQYLPFHKLSPDEFISLIKTFADVFPFVSIWLGYSHGVLVGTLFPQVVKFESLRNIKDEFLDDPYLLAVSYLLNQEGIRNFDRQTRINTDNQPILEFFTPASLKRENWELNMNSLFRLRAEVSQLIKGIDDLEKLNRYLLGQKYFIEGLIYQNRGKRQEMLEAFRKVLEINPENKEIKLFLQIE